LDQSHIDDEIIEIGRTVVVIAFISSPTEARQFSTIHATVSLSHHLFISMLKVERKKIDQAFAIVLVYLYKCAPPCMQAIATRGFPNKCISGEAWKQP